MARLKVMLTDSGRTSTVRRQVSVDSMSEFVDNALSALCEVASALNVPGNAFRVSISEGDDEQEDEQKEQPRQAAGGAGSGDGEGEE